MGGRSLEANPPWGPATDQRCVVTALHRTEEELEANKASGFFQGTEVAVDQFVEHVKAMTQVRAMCGRRLVRVVSASACPDEEHAATRCSSLAAYWSTTASTSRSRPRLCGSRPP